jgi:hypothetical protein
MNILAYYLPQFHEIPENNEWWGKGFTEWTNVKKARPLFDGHYMPRVPLGENYYDLTDISVQKWQVELAKKYGIYGFCMYHYWFNGHMLLEKPINQYLEHKELDLPFCFSWANEYWTNGWVSSENKILMAHDNSDEQDWIDHFNYFLPFFKDDRYIKIEGKPLLIIYFPNILQKCNEMLQCWRSLAKENGFPDLYVMYQKAMTHFDSSVDKSGFDAGIEFQPGYALEKNTSANTRRIANIRFKVVNWLKLKFGISFKKSNRETALIHWSYDDIWTDIINSKPDNDNMYPGAFVDWDNTPRKQYRGSVYDGVNPEKFEKYMTLQIENAKKNYNKDYLFIFAWNEWGESGYLEPDERYQYKYLEAIRKALEFNNEFPHNTESFEL